MASDELDQFFRVPGFPGYSVTRHGEVFSHLKRTGFGKFSIAYSRAKKLQLKRRSKNKKYLTVSLMRDGFKKRTSVHQLICEVFHGPRPPGMSALHADDDPGNNSAENLRWGTGKENFLDAVKNGSMGFGFNSVAAKLRSRSELMLMFSLHESGCSSREIGNGFGISQSSVLKIVKGITYPGELPVDPPPRKAGYGNGLNSPVAAFKRKEDVLKVFSLRGSGLSHRKIAKSLNCSAGTVGRILRGIGYAGIGGRED